LNLKTEVSGLYDMKNGKQSILLSIFVFPCIGIMIKNRWIMQEDLFKLGYGFMFHNRQIIPYFIKRR